MFIRAFHIYFPRIAIYTVLGAARVRLAAGAAARTFAITGATRIVAAAVAVASASAIGRATSTCGGNGLGHDVVCDMRCLWGR